MSMDPVQFRHLITKVLIRIGMFSDAACELLMGTCAKESGFGTWLYQLGGGPGLGFFQMEPATEQGIWLHHLPEFPDKRQRLIQVTGVYGPDPWALETRLDYQIGMARHRYAWVPDPLPDPDDIEAMGFYWDTFYNRNPDAGTVAEFVECYLRYCRG